MDNRLSLRDSLMIDFESEENYIVNGNEEEYDKSYYYMIDTLEIAINNGQADDSISEETLKTILKYLEDKGGDLDLCYHNILMCFYNDLDLSYLKE